MMEKKGSAKTFGGEIVQYKITSEQLKSDTTFRVFIPGSGKYPVLYFLSGLTCTDENFATKAGALKKASELGIALVMPDTSPRGDGVPNEEGWDFGHGAGFYIDATREPYSTHYRMYSYITQELPGLLSKELSDKLDLSRQSIFGHSMGGHGALTLFLKNPGLYKSASAFSPICHPSDPRCQWGQKAFTGYLGSDSSTWKQHDATELIKTYEGPKVEILIDQGSADNFLPQNQLQPEEFEKAAKECGYPVKVRMQEGYDHSYYFISTFVEDHLEHHAKYLK
ncbi:S-formylglutathione hydrolase [Acrasis kona]|uniref:S-formylglutathione hydrolase n=1 Tax=Acrasis kona TaxID=1008807 RepID=A0AAW2YJ26_9EUKA